MAVTLLPESALSLGSRIGRHFSLVSMLPALFLVVWTYGLVVSGAWSASPDLQAVTTKLGSWSISEVAWLLAATLLLALFLHPLQFAMTQLLEGYWGSSRLLVKLATVRILHHRNRYFRMDYQVDRNNDTLNEAVKAGYPDREGRWSAKDLKLGRDELLAFQSGDEFIPNLVARDAARKERGRYPEARRVLPTRLGNTLRHYEDSAGSQYGLDELLTAPHFALITPQPHARYLEDCGTAMDTTIRLCMISLLATAVSVVFLATDGLWLLVALVPYGFAYLAYRAAIVAAEDYGAVRSTIIDLHRFLLYERLGLQRPRDTEGERATNKRLMALLRNGEQGARQVLKYESEEKPSPYR